MGQKLKRVCPRCGCRLKVRSIPLESTPTFEKISRYVYCGGDSSQCKPSCGYNHSETVTVDIENRVLSIDCDNYFNT